MTAGALAVWGRCPAWWLVLWLLVWVPTQARAQTAEIETEIEAEIEAETAPWVRAVELRLDGALARPVDLPSLLAFGPGDRLTESAVRRTLSNLHATGLVQEAQILRRPAPEIERERPFPELEEIIAVVVVHGRVWVEAVELVGNLGRLRTQLLRLLEQRPGSPLDDEKVLAGHFAMQDLLRKKGFHNAEVSLEVKRRSQQRTRVIYNVEIGERSLIGEIRFSQDPAPLSAAALRTKMGLRSGLPYRQQAITARREKLQRWLVRQGFLTAEVGAPTEAFATGSREVDLEFPLQLGPKIEVEVVGASLRRLQRRGLLPFLGDRRLSESLVAQSCERIEDDFQHRGRYRARADYRFEDLAEGVQKLTLEVDLGERYELRSLRLEGNTDLDDEELLPLIRTAPKRRLSPGSGRLVSQVLEEDLANLRSFYLLQGFFDVEIGPVSIAEDGDMLALEIPIREGRRRRLVNLDFEGNTLFETEELRGKLPLQRGGPFHPVVLDDSVNILRTLYEDEGYLQASIEARLDWNEEGTLVDVRMEIYEGPRSTVDRIILRGHKVSNPRAIRHLTGLRSGEVISRRRLLEAERELYRLGVFSRVDVDMVQAGEGLEERDVVVQVEEGRRWRLAYGFSYHSEDGLGSLWSVTRNNIGGRGGRLQLDARGNERNRLFRLIYDEPSVLGSRIPITFTLFREEEEKLLFDVETTGAQIALIEDYGASRLGLLYDYRLVEQLIEPEALVNQGSIDREDRPAEVSSVTGSLFIDRRDDPLVPTSGWSTSLRLEYAFPFLAAEAKYLKGFWQQTLFRPLGTFGSVAASLRLGAIEGFDDTVDPDPLVPETLANALIPVSERFFAGGRTSHRAYERDLLGQPGQTLIPQPSGEFLEVGGNGLMVLNLDYRFPISGDFGGLVFFDYGNVWADWRDFDPGELKAGVGFGFRYRSPVGSIRLEMGWKLDREPFESTDPVLLLSFGDPF